MTSYKILIAFALLVAVMFTFLPAGDAFAQGDSDELQASDKKTAQKRGVEQSLGNRKLGGEESDGPTAFQMGLGIGSCFVMIAVVKWL